MSKWEGGGLSGPQAGKSSMEALTRQVQSTGDDKTTMGQQQAWAGKDKPRPRDTPFVVGRANQRRAAASARKLPGMDFHFPPGGVQGGGHWLRDLHEAIGRRRGGRWRGGRGSKNGRRGRVYARAAGNPFVHRRGGPQSDRPVRPVRSLVAPDRERGSEAHCTTRLARANGGDGPAILPMMVAW